MNTLKWTGTRLGRYALFGFDSHYPKGGMEDLKGYFNTVDELRHILKTIEDEYVEKCSHYTECDYYQILDTASGSFVACDDNEEVLSFLTIDMQNDSNKIANI